jgi:hypothetical protein
MKKTSPITPSAAIIFDFPLTWALGQKKKVNHKQALSILQERLTTFQLAAGIRLITTRKGTPA